MTRREHDSLNFELCGGETRSGVVMQRSRMEGQMGTPGCHPESMKAEPAESPAKNRDEEKQQTLSSEGK